MPANLDRFAIDENLQVFLTSDAESEIRENSKFYLKEENEIKAYQRLQKLCDDLNTHCEPFKIDLYDRNSIAPAVAFGDAERRGTPIFLSRMLKNFMRC